MKTKKSSKVVVSNEIVNGNTGTDAALAHHVAEAIKLLDKVETAIAGDTPALTALDKKRSARVRKGGDRVIETIAQLVTQFGLTSEVLQPNVILERLAHAQAVVPLQKRLEQCKRLRETSPQMKSGAEECAPASRRARRRTRTKRAGETRRSGSKGARRKVARASSFRHRAVRGRRVASSARLIAPNMAHEGRKPGAKVTTPFDKSEAAARLGHPGEAFHEVAPYHLPEIYWLRIGSDENVLGGPFIVRSGELVTTKGYATASAWLRRAVMPLKEVSAAVYVAQVLENYESLPLGWSAAHAEVDHPATGERGGLRIRPFELKLVARGYVHTTSRLPEAALGGRLDAPTRPPRGRGPSCGYAPSQPCRAVLTEKLGKLTWAVEQRDAAGGWAVMLKEPIE